jgi:hypothetical protein
VPVGRFQRLARSDLAIIVPQDCSSSRLSELALVSADKLLVPNEPSDKKLDGSFYDTHTSAAN